MQAIIVLTVVTLLAGDAFAELTPKEVVDFINREGVCRKAVMESDNFTFVAAAAGISVLSVVFFVVSIVLFIVLLRDAAKQVAAAEAKAHQVMDAALVSLIPVEILKKMGSVPNEKKSKEKTKTKSKEKTKTKSKDKTDRTEKTDRNNEHAYPPLILGSAKSWISPFASAAARHVKKLIPVEHRNRLIRNQGIGRSVSTPIYPSRMSFVKVLQTFRRMLYGEFSEGYRREVEIGDAKPETFGRILQYLYTMKIQLTDTEFDDILDMLQLAHLYQLQGLQNEISEHLKGEISSDNTCSLLRYAKLFALQGLADACVENFEADTLNVLRNSDFSEAPVEIIELLLSRDDLFVEELEVFRALRAWISWHEPVSAELRERVLKLVQLPKMKIQDLLISVRPTKLFEDKDLLDALDVQREENAFIDGYRLPCPTENVATLERGAYVITGQMSGSAQSRNVLLDCSNSLNKSISCRLLSSEGITVKLGCCYLIGSIEFTLWDGDDRYYSYYVETSTDGDEWCVAADSTNEECQ
ncbi:hypothetical protein QR680_007507 [Steinernema hermaphroditum]|uniref:BTB domain-containing protein n=1 Tax=Steinernema hermaphroditum TaxID=289476 RepID=A0AA39M6I4_9BILA|nr:hypothetical protein QR680_007507 [Steinernema hermaphroditum]